jgi:hypothetical protein
MIRDLDTSLKSMLKGEAPAGSELAGANISFAAPDKTWQGQGKGLDLDVYMYRLLDNRELRSNDRRLTYNGDGTVTEELFPARIECSYIISAWNKSADIPGLEKELQEHRLMSQVLYVLWRNPTMPPQYLVGLLSNAEIALPMVAAENEDMAAKPDFWSALEVYVKPAITCRITIAMYLKLNDTGPIVTSTQTNVVTDQTIYAIGGTVRNANAPATTIPQAWVRLDASPRTYATDNQGNFIIDQIIPGLHVLTVRAVGFKEGTRQIRVPDPTGIYDVSLTPF